MGIIEIKNTLYLNIGKLSDASHKHRGAILMVAVIMLFIDPEVKVTFGSASLAGLGISVTPAQEISLGLLLFAILVYKLIAFWVSVLLESGTDSARAERKALMELDPGWDAEQHDPTDFSRLIRNHKQEIIYKWTVRQILWEFVFPNLVGVVALSHYLRVYIT